MAETLLLATCCRRGPPDLRLLPDELLEDEVMAPVTSERLSCCSSDLDALRTAIQARR